LRKSSGNVVQRVRARGAVTSLALGRGGRVFLLTTDRGAALVERVGGGLVRELPQPGPVVRGVFDPSGARVATIARGRGGRELARSYDVASGRLLHVLPQLGVHDLEFSPDGSLLATGSHDGTIAFWDPRTGRRVRLLDDQAHNVSDLAFSPDGTL